VKLCENTLGQTVKPINTGNSKEPTLSQALDTT